MKKKRTKEILCDDAPIKISKVEHADKLFLCELQNVSPRWLCDEIIKNSNICNFQDMKSKYENTKRNNSRLLTTDKTLAKCIWERFEGSLLNILSEYDMELQPLGFDVLRGEWELAGINDAMRINRYSAKENEFFSPHKDSQFCPSGDERSIFSLVIYLNDGYNGGETCFYFPKEPPAPLQSKGMTIQEEIALHGGINDGFNEVRITPVTGHAVLFTPNVLHESLPIKTVSSGDTDLKTHVNKYILRTDIMLKRKNKPFGFAVSEKEMKDYFECLEHFREAQHQELKGNSDLAGELYERSMSIRYCYPACLKAEDYGTKEASLNQPITNYIPALVWDHVFGYLDGSDAMRLVFAFPELKQIKDIHTSRFESSLKNSQNKDRPKFFPEVDSRLGIITCFEFPDAQFFSENKEGCYRVAAMYSFALLGHDPSSECYTVNYNPDTQEVCAIALENLLWSAFHSQRCYGSVYRVRQHDVTKKNVLEDFSASVDRTYMTLRHGAQFMGVELTENFRVDTNFDMNWYPPFELDNHDKKCYGKVVPPDILPYERDDDKSMWSCCDCFVDTCTEDESNSKAANSEKHQVRILSEMKFSPDFRLEFSPARFTKKECFSFKTRQQ